MQAAMAWDNRRDTGATPDADEDEGAPRRSSIQHVVWAGIPSPTLELNTNQVFGGNHD